MSSRSNSPRDSQKTKATMAVGGATGLNMLKNFAAKKKEVIAKPKEDDDMNVDSEVEDLDVVIKQTAESYQKAIEKETK